MAPPITGDGRGLERRVIMLERQTEQFKAALQRVELEQAHVREVIDSRFRALDKGQEMLLLKFDGLAAQIVRMSGDPTETPAGRVLAERLEAVKGETERRIGEMEAKVKGFDELKTQADQLKGGLALAQNSGIAGILLALAGLGIAALRAFL